MNKFRLFCWNQIAKICMISHKGGKKVDSTIIGAITSIIYTHFIKPIDAEVSSFEEFEAINRGEFDESDQNV